MRRKIQLGDDISKVVHTIRPNGENELDAVLAYYSNLSLTVAHERPQNGGGKFMWLKPFKKLFIRIAPRRRIVWTRFSNPTLTVDFEAAFY